MTSCKLDPKLNPTLLCHPKMAGLPMPSLKVSQTYHPPPPPVPSINECSLTGFRTADELFQGEFQTDCCHLLKIKNISSL